VLIFSHFSKKSRDRGHLINGQLILDSVLSGGWWWRQPWAIFGLMRRTNVSAPARSRVERSEPEPGVMAQNWRGPRTDFIHFR
jgi:hypothetical protein